MKTPMEWQEEVDQLQQEVQQRDLLVQQLSEELFRLVKGNIAFAPSQELSEQHTEELRSLNQKLAVKEEALNLAQTQLQQKEQEAIELRQSVQELTDSKLMLEQLVEELPNIYRSKFAERMVPIKSKVEMLQKENRQLHIELQSLSYRLASRTRPQKIQLPQMQTEGPALPVLSNA